MCFQIKPKLYISKHTKNQILISKWSGEIQYKTRKLNWQVCPTHQWVSKEQSGLGRSLWKKDCGEEEERNPIAKEMNFHITEEHIQSCMRTAVKNGVEMRRFLSLQTPHTPAIKGSKNTHFWNIEHPEIPGFNTPENLHLRKSLFNFAEVQGNQT